MNRERKDLIEAFFLEQFGRYEKRLQPDQKEAVLDSIARDMAREGEVPHSSADQEQLDEAAIASANQDYEIWRGMHADQRPEVATESAFRVWKPDRLEGVGVRPPEFPDHYRLETIIPWEAEQSVGELDGAMQVYEMSGDGAHELMGADVITTPTGELFRIEGEPGSHLGRKITWEAILVTDPTQRMKIAEAIEQADRNYEAWQQQDIPPEASIDHENFTSEADMAKAQDQSKETIDPALAMPDAEKARHVERDAEVVEQRSRFERSWAAEMKTRAQESMYRGNGANDELSVKSAGQYSTSFSQQVRPGSTRADLEDAVEKMGLGPQADRQRAQEAGTRNDADKAQDLGKEAER